MTDAVVAAVIMVFGTIFGGSLALIRQLKQDKATEGQRKASEAAALTEIALSLLPPLESRIDDQDDTILKLSSRVLVLEEEKIVLSDNLEQADAKIIELQKSGVSTDEVLQRMRDRFVQVRDLLIETHRVALSLVDQLTNDHDSEPNVYPPRIEDFIDGNQKTN